MFELLLFVKFVANVRFNQLFDFIVVFSVKKHLFYSKTVNECFLLCQGDLCIYQKISFYMYCFCFYIGSDSRWQKESITYFMFLIIILWIFVTVANLKNDLTNQVHLFMNGTIELFMTDRYIYIYSLQFCLPKINKNRC